MGKEMDATGHPGHMPSADRCCLRNHTLRRERNRAQWEFRRPKNRQLSFPLFQESTKEDAISYWDWCSEIEDALKQGHDPTKVKEAMFASLEGMAKDNAKMIDENGDLHSGWAELLVWGVHDIPVTQCCLVRSTAEADRICPHLL